ncbi:hypothetical protein Ae201684_002968 [Aphanomyces euteiches]|uniref:Uncharacterized protein n=1 Tax=Aphanomyces euteiches TaxID=100861 RepID=A0A6G0XNQ6_9STRA|nr:hypothetical protein Ae201684_002968 [Aphanomyces euteiches]
MVLTVNAAAFITKNKGYFTPLESASSIAVSRSLFWPQPFIQTVFVPVLSIVLLDTLNVVRNNDLTNSRRKFFQIGLTFLYVCLA